MDKILIDIDNKTPGAITRQIVQFLIPKCALYQGTNENTYSILQVNKHFNKIMHNKCKINTFFKETKCKEHSPDYAEIMTIHNTIQEAEKCCHTYIHFPSKKMATKAQKYIGLRRSCNICCSGKGFRL